MQGGGSQHFNKKEVAPLFKPQENMQWAHGAPNNSDFFRSRMNPSTNMNNVKLWEEQRVGPGLNQGYTTEGSGGFNSGLDARMDYMPKTVDELRVKTNPKLTFGLANHEGPAICNIKNPGVMGKMEKYAPDTYFVNGPDRWFTTGGLEKGQTARGEEVLQDVNRPFTTSEYFGSGSKDGGATYVSGKYQGSSRPELDSNPVTNPCATQQFNASPKDYGREGYNPIETNRMTTESSERTGVIGGMAKAVIAPIMDILRPSRKENVIGNIRPNGNVASYVNALPVFNPADRTKTTIKETTEGKLDFNHLNMENQTDGGGYMVNEQQPINNQRDTTSCSYTGNTGGSANQSGMQTYNAAYNQHNNVNKSYPNRPNQGGTQVFNGETNVCIGRLDCDRNNNRMWVPQGGPTAIPSTINYGKMVTPQNYSEERNNDRINPDILTAFKENPYTQSLQSFA